MNKSVVGYNHPQGQLQHAVSMTDANMVQCLITIFEVSIGKKEKLLAFEITILLRETLG